MDNKYNNIINNNRLIENLGRNKKIFKSQEKLCDEFTTITLNAVFKGIPADQYLSKLMRQRKEIGSRDRKLLNDLIFALFRWRGWLSNWENIIGRNRQFFAALILDNKFNHPILIYWGEKFGLPKNWKEKMQSKTSIQKIQILGNWYGQPAKSYDITDLFPVWFTEPLDLENDIYLIKNKSGIKNSILSIFQKRPPIWIRLDENNISAIKKKFREEGLSINPHPVLTSAATIKSQINLNILHSYQEGMFEVQDISSQIVGLVCNPQYGDYWWDACAGAGGKTLHLAALMKGSGKILATDKRKSALKEAFRRCKKWKFNQIIFKNWTCGEEKITNFFDGVLVDAPCSGTGTWRRNPDARWRTSTSDINHYVQLQKSLLSICSKNVKPGGKLIYSVCSLLKQETLSIINEFISSQPEFQFEIIRNPLNKKVNKGALWILPHDQNSDGMFIACFKKKLS